MTTLSDVLFATEFTDNSLISENVSDITTFICVFNSISLIELVNLSDRNLFMNCSYSFP